MRKTEIDRIEKYLTNAACKIVEAKRTVTQLRKINAAKTKKGADKKALRKDGTEAVLVINAAAAAAREELFDVVDLTTPAAAK